MNRVNKVRGVSCPVRIDSEVEEAAKWPVGDRLAEGCLAGVNRGGLFAAGVRQNRVIHRRHHQYDMDALRNRREERAQPVNPGQLGQRLRLAEILRRPRWWRNED